jgi:hypothetical protein
MGSGPFVLRVHLATQGHDAVLDPDVQVLRLALGLPGQRFADALLDAGRRRPLLDRDLVADADHAHQVAQRQLRVAPLEGPVDLPMQRDPALVDGHAHGVLRQGHVRAQGLLGRAGDVGVVAPVVRRQADVQIQRQRLDPCHAVQRALDRPLLRVGVQVPADRDDTVLHGDADLGGRHLRVPGPASRSRFSSASVFMNDSFGSRAGP